MPTYPATFRTDAEYATHEFTAATPAEALELALAFYADHDYALYFDSYDSRFPVNQIEINDPNGGKPAVWRDPDLILHLAAGDLLAALETQTNAAQAVIDAWDEGDLAATVRALAEFDTGVARRDCEGPAAC